MTTQAAPQTAIQKKPTDIAKSLYDTFNRWLPTFGKLATKGYEVERASRSALNAITNNPTLLRCSQISIVKAFAEACFLGLDVGGVSQEGWIIPYGPEAKFQPGYRGIAKLVRQADPNVVAIEARVVLEGDKFHYVLGLRPELVHEPSADEEAARELTHAYSIIRYKGDFATFEVLTRSTIDGIRDRYSKSYEKHPNESPWTSEYGEMAKKTVFKRQAKWVDQTPRLARALALDNHAEGTANAPEPLIDTSNVVDGEFTRDEPQTRTAALKAKLAGKKPDAKEPEAEDGDPRPMDDRIAEAKSSLGERLARERSMPAAQVAARLAELKTLADVQAADSALGEPKQLDLTD